MNGYRTSARVNAVWEKENSNVKGTKYMSLNFER